MIIFLAIQTTYDNVELALYNQTECVASTTIDKLHASKLLIPELKNLLSSAGISLSDLACIVANQGPGPFTTLRVVIASINGLSFAAAVPLIGVNGLQALVDQFQTPDFPITIALLNAFNRDLYFGIASDHDLITGCKKNTQLLDDIAAQFPDQKLFFIGNGAALHKSEIQLKFASRAFFPDKIPQTCSLDSIARLGLTQWLENNHVTRQLLPIYLKNMA